jgi:guanylate kinase
MPADPGPPLLVVLSGPSGAGKDAVLNRLKRSGQDFCHVTTMTTRPMREREVDGTDYYFVTVEHFRELIRADELLEYAEVYGNWYGVPKAPARQALAAGRDVVIKVDVQGAATIRKLVPRALLLFLTPPHISELTARLKLRHTETEVDLARRIRTAEDEMRQADKFDYVVENPTGDLDAAVKRIQEIMAVERSRPEPRRVQL